MSNNINHPLGDAPWFHVILSTGFGAGFVPIAPGTAGALVALALWWAGYKFLPVDVLFWVTLITTIAVTVVGAWTSNIMEKYWGEDPRTVVIDEFIGIWIPALVAPCGENTWLLAILGFVAFRIIDIFKPLGCRWVDQNVKGGWCLILDDDLSGFYSLIICLIVKQFL